MKMTFILFSIIILTTLSLFSSCVQKEKSDMPENISVVLNNNHPIKLYNHESFIELTGVYCDFFQDYEKNKKSYAALMEKLKKKNWKFDHISLEYEHCMTDSMNAAFLTLNREVFGTTLESVTFEEELIFIKLKSASN